MFDSFNARYLDYADVAKTFIPNSQFDELISRSHTVLIGPRGAGKTTLLKMLSGPALGAWPHRDAQQYRERIDFTGVFVPTDRNWASQLDNIGEALGPDWQSVFSVAAFTNHVLLALVEAMVYRVEGDPERPDLRFRSIALDRAREERLARELGAVWKLRAPPGSLRGLGHLIEDRQSDLAVLAGQEAKRDEATRADRLTKHEHLFLAWQPATVAAISRFNDAAGEVGGRWALLFDELELIPNTMRAQLFGSLRSVDQRLLFKLSLAPYTEGSEALSGGPAMAGHDFRPVFLTYPKKERAYEFCRDLLSAMADELGIEFDRTEDILGRSLVDEGRVSWQEHGTAYAAGSAIVEGLADLRDKDPSFARYLVDHKIDLNDVASSDGKERAETVRKWRQVAELRNAFAEYDATGAARLRPRKSAPRVYAGETNMFAMVEGNPRLFIGIVYPLLRRSQNGRISADSQVQAIDAATHLFRSLLKARPDGTGRGRSDVELLDVLDKIGNYLADRTIRGPFTPDPPGTFRVDMAADPETLEALQTAVNAGAVIYLPRKTESALLDTLVGKRFRLAYLLAPYYKLPILLGRPVSLSTILSKSGELTVDDDDEPVDSDLAESGEGLTLLNPGPA